MAASSYWNDESSLFPSYEEYLEAQAIDVEAKILELQARIRGFVSRHRGQHASQTHYSDFRLRGSPPTMSAPDPKNEANLTNQGQTKLKAVDKEKSAKEDVEDTGIKLCDPDFAEKRINEMPEGWVAAFTPEGHPFFVDTTMATSTWEHPRQQDTSSLFGPAFNLSWMWRQYLSHQQSTVYLTEPKVPTIGELVVYFCALKDRNDPNRMECWWQEQDVSDSTQSLCEVCCHINFGNIIHSMSGWGFADYVLLGSLRAIAKKTHCAFCRLVIRSFTPNVNDLVRALDDTGLVVPCSLTRSQEWMEFTSKIRVLYIDARFPQREVFRQYYGLRRIHEILQDKQKPPEQKHNDSRLVVNEVDIGLVKSWLQTCEQRHQSASCETGYLDPSFGPLEVTDIHDQSTRINLSCQPLPLSNNSIAVTLIDVESGCLVNTKPDIRYITLSYVWGGPQPFQSTKSNRQDLQTPGSISADNSAIPQTIRDAMKLVKMLGERYLWIDSLCIVQDNAHDKMEQISNMGNIYSKAVLTLVAAHGKSCHAGLPGVRPGSRTTFQHVERVQSIVLANELNYIYDNVQDSVWNTRGWTYQERELSKRCLIFIDSCIYFSCNQMICKEDSGDRDVSLVHEKSKRIRAEYHPAWNNYRRAVQKITKRNFTNLEDIVNAFQGIVSLLQPVFKCDFLYGLPETELDVALLWQPRSTIRRRIHDVTKKPMFPSWSWAGWIGEIDYVWSKHLLDDLSRVQWEVQSTQTKEYVTSDQLRAPRSGQHGLWEYVETSPVGGTPYYYQPKYPNIWCLHPTAKKGDRIPRPLLFPETHVLKFKAMTATFRIYAKPHNQDSSYFDPIPSCEGNHHVLCPIEIMSKENFIAGTVYIPAHLTKDLKSEPREFICLSRRRGFYADSSGCRVYDNYQGYHTYPQPKDDFENIPTKPRLYPGRRGMHQTHDKYDHARYNDCKPWPLYNVMLIEREGDLTFRVAVGIVHTTAFLQAGPVEKLISLA